MRTAPQTEVMMETHEEVAVVWTTLPADADADRFGRILVEERLAACVTVQGGGRSVYRWRDGIEQDDERSVMIKTTADRVAQLQTRIRELHSYDEPEILVVPVVGGSSSYLDWVRQATRVTRSAGSESRR